MTNLTFGKFRLLRRLAIGGMGEVFLAKQDGPEGFEKLLVVKRILEEHSFKPEYVDMFFAEAKLAAKMSHPNIVQIYEMGVIDEAYYISMEFVNGKSLADIVDTTRRTDVPLEPAHVVRIMMQLCDGLGYAHHLVDDDGEEMHIVHRDINLNNVIVSYRGDAKVVDFGIAKSSINDRRTEAGTVKGQFAYMSPEQSAAAPIDHRSDIFSLGVVMYEMLALKNPFHRTNIVQLLEALKTFEPPSITQVNPAFAPLDAILKRALDKDPCDRYQSCADMHADLQQALTLLPKPTQSLNEALKAMFADYIEREMKVLQAARSGKTPPSSAVPSGMLSGSGPKVRPSSAPQALSVAPIAAVDDTVSEQTEPTREADISTMREQIRRSVDAEVARPSSAPRQVAPQAPPPLPLAAYRAQAEALVNANPSPLERQPKSRRVIALVASIAVLVVGGTALAFIATHNGDAPAKAKTAAAAVAVPAAAPAPAPTPSEVAADTEQAATLVLEEEDDDEAPAQPGHPRRVQLAPTRLKTNKRKEQLEAAKTSVVVTPASDNKIPEHWVNMNVQPAVPEPAVVEKAPEKPAYERASKSPARITGENDPPVPASMLTQLRGSKGLVLVKIRINDKGGVDEVILVRSTMPLLNDVVRNHVMANWKFEPPINAGQAVKVEYLQTFQFVFE